MTKKYQVTAIIYDRKDNVLSIAQNSYVKTHPLQAHYAAKANEPHRIFLHAEIAAIVRCRDLTKAHKIVVFRYHNDGTPANSKPCAVCAQALRNTPIKVVEYT
jgi:deoxycytidylate deaminase